METFGGTSDRQTEGKHQSNTPPSSKGRGHEYSLINMIILDDREMIRPKKMLVKCWSRDDN